MGLGTDFFCKARTGIKGAEENLSVYTYIN